MNYVLKAVLVSFAALILFSCSKGNDKASNIDPRTGKHPVGWAVAGTGGAHPAAFRDGPSACYQCHGKDLNGGISQVSCFTASRSGITCHANGPSGHPVGWASPDSHGAAAKALLSGQNGMPHCQLCHGADFTGGIAKVSCLNTAGCHGAGIMSAHSPKPWFSKIGGRTHSNADSSNAAACAVCHTNGANSSRVPSPAAPAGTAPDCFNNTLCHGVEGHAFASWTSAGFHGAAAKAAHGGITVNGQNSPISSFADCTQCHGVRYDGGTSQQTCLNTAGCHGANVASPHPARPWRSTTGGVTHTTTDTRNAGQCAVCHTNGSNSTRSPIAGAATGTTGCFDNTLCHGAEGHPTGWVAFDQHGAAAKLFPGTTTGFSSCQNCHGSTFNNGSAPSCMNNILCHSLLKSSPHPVKPWTSTVAGTPTHTTTDPANAGTCAICHTGGANSDVVPPNPATGTAGCYNNTLCHFHTIPFAPPGVDPSVHGTQFAKPDLTVCQACHGVKGTTSFNGLALGGGVTTIACSSCHSFAKAHPTAWQGSTTNPGETVIYTHRTAGNIANACSICHNVSTVGAGPLAGAPSCFSTTFTNGLNQTGTCHANGPGVAPHNVPYPNHNATARSNFNYCLGCHQVAANAAGSKPPGCQNCHLTSPVATPTGCTSCHAKPPAGNAYPNTASVHASHAVLNVAENADLTAVCNQCHNGQPLGLGLGFGTLDHLNRARARTAAVQPNPVIFGTLATTGGLVPTYAAATQTCANTYCHGSSLTSNTVTAPPPSVILAPAWNTPFPAGSHCNRCHGFPPVTASHASIPLATQCIICHSHVNADGTGFTDPTLHINGTVNANAGIAPHAVPNYNHQTAGTGASCTTTGCHVLGSAASVYPAAVLGNPPDCQGCHKKAAPGIGCGSCHGGTNGKPTGTTFPDRLGFHGGAGNSAHNNTNCTLCHAGGGTGSTINHGPGNRNSNPNLVGPMVNGITPTNGPKGASNTPVTCVHGTINSGCSEGGTKTGW